MVQLLTADMIDVDQIMQMTTPKQAKQGTEDFQQGRVTIVSVANQSAQIEVAEATKQGKQRVSVWLHGRALSLSCTCRNAYGWTPCRHRVAAALGLRAHLEQNPPKLWRMVLEQGARLPVRRPTVHHSVVIFSIQEHYDSWSIVPYSLSIRQYDQAVFASNEALAHEIAQGTIIQTAKPLRSRITRTGYPHVPDTAISAANMLLGNPYGNYAYSTRDATFYESLLPLLTSCLVYLGDEEDPFRERIVVLDQFGEIQADLATEAAGMRLRAQVQAGDQVLPLRRNEYTVFVADPLWLLIGQSLVRITNAGGVASALIDYPDLIVPNDDQEEFLDKHFLDLTSRMAVHGNALAWDELAVEPEPCLYLNEQEGQFQAELRFRYGSYEFAYDKTLPAEGVRRIVGQPRFVRIKRQPDREQTAWQTLSSYGLKRSTEPAIFLLRANVSVVDFLLHQVPKLVTTGYTIFGEQALTSVRVNRNKPTISFKVTSGIDWFDVDTAVNFGELSVSLKELRQAVRKRERYIKLADGSIGELPAEWLQRYRHMLALGDEQDDGDMRFDTAQITLLDQLLAEADRTQIDEEFQRRRDKLRSFDGITPQALPPNFVGTLRPYQKFGYDWLHFLREYGFGGCLADDMGVGKCVAPDTNVFVNGALKTAEHIWGIYAGAPFFDGEGYWSEPTSALWVNAIDSSGNIVEAPIVRLYRQHIHEPVRTVVLQDGSRITTTKRHKLLTHKGWNNQLHVGDYICVPSTLRWNGNVVDCAPQTRAAYQRLDNAELQHTRQSLAQLAEQDVFYSKIVAVEEELYEGWVYDFEVAEHHNFVANNIICHNTIQTLAFLASLYHAKPDEAASLIVMPRSLLFNWQREAAKFAPSLSVYLHADQGRANDATEFNKHNLVLTTYGTMLRDVQLLREHEFATVILDESQAIKNPLAETARAARLLRGKQRLVLTGTPVENTTMELWSQFAFLNPGLLGNLDYFRVEFATPIERAQNQETADFLRKMVYPFILRRTKDQVAPDLPPRTEKLIVCDMEPAQRKLYNKQRDYYRAKLLGLMDEGGMGDARMQILEGLLRLRQICNHPRLIDAKFRGVSGKFEVLMDTLTTLRAEGHRALVFSQFVQMLTIVRDALDEGHVPYAYLDGQTRDRQGAVDRFQTDESVPFFLISLKAGGVGLNLTAADYVIHIDPWWNPAVEQQATDRTHRIGQDKPVFVYKLIARDTVEEKILQLQERKRALVEQVIGAEGGVFKSLTREDIDVLFS